MSCGEISIADSAAGAGWESVMTNTLNAASVSKYAGPTEDGGYWNDGSLQVTPHLYPSWTPAQHGRIGRVQRAYFAPNES